MEIVGLAAGTPGKLGRKTNGKLGYKQENLKDTWIKLLEGTYRI